MCVIAQAAVAFQGVALPFSANVPSHPILSNNTLLIGRTSQLWDLDFSTNGAAYVSSSAAGKLGDAP